ncbi:unnamed protein product [Colias eurytheme]|nr:unnamed protein product [Colias eurytheme]
MRHEQASVKNVMRLVPMQKRVRPPPTFTTYSVRSTNRPRYDSLGQVSSKILPSPAAYTRLSTNRPEYDRLGQVSSQTLSSSTPTYSDPPQDRQVSNYSPQSSNNPGLGNIDTTTMPYYSPASTVEPVRSDDPNDKDYGAHDRIHSGIQNVAGAVLGNVHHGLDFNIGGHVGANGQRRPDNQGNSNRPGDTVVVVIKEEDNNNDNYRPPDNNFQRPNGPPHNNHHHGPPHNNHHHGPPHNQNNQFGQNNQRPNYNNPNNFINRPPNRPNYGNDYPNNDYQNQGNGNFNNRPNNQQHGNGYGQNNYPNQQQGNNGYGQNNYPNNQQGNDNGQNNNGYPNNQNNNFNRPNFNNDRPDITGNPNQQVGLTIPFDKTTQNTERPSTEFISKPDYQHKEESTKKPVDNDAPFFVPLNPNEYSYGGNKINITDPKRDTNNKAESEDEDFNIDIRIKDE